MPQGHLTIDDLEPDRPLLILKESVSGKDNTCLGYLLDIHGNFLDAHYGRIAGLDSETAQRHNAYLDDQYIDILTRTGTIQPRRLLVLYVSSDPSLKCPSNPDGYSIRTFTGREVPGLVRIVSTGTMIWLHLHVTINDAKYERVWAARKTKEFKAGDTEALDFELTLIRGI